MVLDSDMFYPWRELCRLGYLDSDLVILKNSSFGLGQGKVKVENARNSRNKNINVVTSCILCERAKFSASVFESAISVCSLLHHSTGNSA